ncbi:MAG: hypothetical protein K9L60_13925 [Methylovulum sp.]|jgi:hypothetical protein|nr:hypothetical protein [Methylovulum sp.]MCF7999394.1 hypothetical protein [Methylovulum sp.]
MKKFILTTTLLGSLLINATPVMAIGFISLRANGFAVTGGISAYTRCNLSGNFGSNPNGSTPPTFSPNSGANNTCAIPSINPPVAGYLQTASVVRDIVMNNAYTLNQPVTLGTVTDRVWRNGTNCIYGAKIRLNKVDYDRRTVSPGFQYFEINDILRAGFKNRGPLSIAYHYTTSGAGTSDDALYRAGLTFTSVVNKQGDSARPLSSIAPLSQNWVDFTSDINFLDDDGSSVRDSSWLLVKSTCTTAIPTALSGALLFRQMGQEEQPLIELKVDGYAPVGGNTVP